MVGIVHYYYKEEIEEDIEELFLLLQYFDIYLYIVPIIHAQIDGIKINALEF